jgi:hypothetical protein
MKSGDNKSFPICRLCGKNEASCKAHIIPRKFYHRMRSGAPHLAVVDPQNPQRRLTSQSGIHEQGLLCSECDGKIGLLDNYAYTILPEFPDKTKIHPLPILKNMSIVDMGEIDLPRFFQFAVSLAWRAGISSHPFFEWVKLGSYEERLRQYLLAGIATPKPEISVLVNLFQPPEFEKIMPHPNSAKFSGRNVIVFYLYPWKLVIKLDRRPFDDSLNKMVLAADGNSIAMVQNYLTRGEIAYLNNVRQKHLQSKGQ